MIRVGRGSASRPDRRRRSLRLGRLALTRVAVYVPPSAYDRRRHSSTAASHRRVSGYAKPRVLRRPKGSRHGAAQGPRRARRTYALAATIGGVAHGGSICRPPQIDRRPVRVAPSLEGPDMTEATRGTGSGTDAADAAIRPFRVEVPDEALVDLRRRIAATRWPEQETVTDRVAGRAARHDAGARALLGDRPRLAQVRGEAERPPAVPHRDRRCRHPLHPRPLDSTRTRCRSSSRTAGPARSSSS